MHYSFHHGFHPLCTTGFMTAFIHYALHPAQSTLWHISCIKELGTSQLLQQESGPEAHNYQLPPILRDMLCYPIPSSALCNTPQPCRSHPSKLGHVLNGTAHKTHRGLCPYPVHILLPLQYIGLSVPNLRPQPASASKTEALHSSSK